MVGAHIFAVAAGSGAGSEVKVYDATTGAIKIDFHPFDSNDALSMAVARGDVDGDGVPDIIAAQGPAGKSLVKVFSGVDLHLIRSFAAYDATFSGGVFVAAADLNQDGFADTITGAGANGGPHVKVFDGKTGNLLASFYAYSVDFTGGVRVAGADVNGDGKADIITGAGPGGGPHVKVISGANQHLLFEFMAFDPTYTGGIFVSGGDLDGDGKAEMIVGQGQGTGAVRTFSGVDTHLLGSIAPFLGTAADGVRVSTADRDGDRLLDVVAATGPFAPSNVRSYKGTTLAFLNEFAPYDPAFMGGVFVA